MRKTTLSLFCGAAVIAFGIAGCDRPAADADPAITADTTSVETAPAQPEALSLTSGRNGEYLADANGRAVYMLEGDASCIGACLEAWPPVVVDTSTPTVATSLQTALVGTVPRDDGSLQLTYNGHPLYYYARDNGPDMAMGHDVTDDFGEWYLVGPAGVAVVGADASAGVTAEAPMMDDGMDNDTDAVDDMNADDMDATDAAPPPVGEDATETPTDSQY